MAYVASWITGYDNLTPLGRWVADRLPHTEVLDRPGHDWGCYRIYGVRPYCRCCLFDYTWMSFGRREPFEPFVYTGIQRRVRVLGLTLLEWRSNHPPSATPR